MLIFGDRAQATQESLKNIIALTQGLLVQRTGKARSSTPFPSSTDLETALCPVLMEQGFQHHVRMEHPRTGDGFEYDFWRPEDQIAMEIMGYRADDEVYKDILKFHVHQQTRVGVVWVPRWKWISGKRTETNFKATVKALAFAESYMAVEALVALTYDWGDQDKEAWPLVHVYEE